MNQYQRSYYNVVEIRVYRYLVDRAKELRYLDQYTAIYARYEGYDTCNIYNWLTRSQIYKLDISINKKTLLDKLDIALDNGEISLDKYNDLTMDICHSNGWFSLSQRLKNYNLTEILRRFCSPFLTDFEDEKKLIH